MARIITSILLFLFSFQSESHCQVAMFHAHNQVSGVTPPLDTYSGARWALAFRKLRTAYSGNCLRMRRTSDNTEQDFGFMAFGIVDTPAVLTWVGSSEGRIVKVYDQSGNGIDATTTDTASQPVIVYNNKFIRIGTTIGFLHNINGRRFWLRIVTNGTTTGSYFSVISYANTTDGIGTGGNIVLSQEVNAGYMLIANGGSGAAANSGVGTITTYRDGTSFVNTTRIDVANNLAAPGATKVMTLSVFNINNSAWTIYSTNRETAAFFGGIFISEMIMYHSDQSANRVGIETNMKNYYGL